MRPKYNTYISVWVRHSEKKSPRKSEPLQPTVNAQAPNPPEVAASSVQDRAKDPRRHLRPPRLHARSSSNTGGGRGRAPPRHGGPRIPAPRRPRPAPRLAARSSSNTGGGRGRAPPRPRRRRAPPAPPRPRRGRARASSASATARASSAICVAMREGTLFCLVFRGAGKMRRVYGSAVGECFQEGKELCRTQK